MEEIHIKKGLLGMVFFVHFAPGSPVFRKGGARKWDLLSLVSHSDALTTPAWALRHCGCLLFSPTGWDVLSGEPRQPIPSMPWLPQGCCSCSLS